MNQGLLQSMVASHNFINFCSFSLNFFFVVVGLVWFGLVFFFETRLLLYVVLNDLKLIK